MAWKPRVYSKAGELRYKLSAAANINDVLVIHELRRRGVIIGPNAGNAFASGDEVVVATDCGPQFEYEATSGLASKTVGERVGIDNTTRKVVESTDTTIDAWVTQAYTTGQPKIIVSLDADMGVKYHPISLPDFRVHDALGSHLPAVAAADDLALASGVYGTSTSLIVSEDFSAGSTLAYARVIVPMPDTLMRGAAGILRVSAKMAAVADDACTLDAQAFQIKAGQDGSTFGTDLVTTVAQDINSATETDYDFTLAALANEPADHDLLLDIRLLIVGTDAAGSGVIANLLNVGLVY